MSGCSEKFGSRGDFVRRVLRGQDTQKDTPGGLEDILLLSCLKLALKVKATETGQAFFPFLFGVPFGALGCFYVTSRAEDVCTSHSGGSS